MVSSQMIFVNFCFMLLFIIILAYCMYILAYCIYKQAINNVDINIDNTVLWKSSKIK